VRKLKGPLKTVIYLYVVAMGLFHLYTATFGSLEAYLQRNVHLLWILPLTFILYPASKAGPKDEVSPFD